MSEELKPCPMCGGPAEMDTLRGYRRWSDGSVGNAIAVYCTECTLEISVCRDDVPDIEPEQVAEMWNRRAQPAAPAVCSSCDGTGKISGLPCAWCMQSAAPSVAPEPVAWTLQSELDAAQTTCSAHLWFTNPRNSAWTALFTREKSAAHPPRAPLSDEHVYAVVRSVQPHLATTSKAWRELAEDCRYWLKAERAVTEAAHGIRGQG